MPCCAWCLIHVQPTSTWVSVRRPASHGCSAVNLRVYSLCPRRHEDATRAQSISLQLGVSRLRLLIMAWFVKLSTVNFTTSHFPAVKLPKENQKR